MHRRDRVRLLAAGVGICLAGSGIAVSSSSPAVAQDSGAPARYLVTARSAGEVGAVRAQAEASGAQVVDAVPELDMVVVNATPGQRAALEADSRVGSVGSDSLRRITTADPTVRTQTAPGVLGTQPVAVPGAAPDRPDVDPAQTYRGLQWDFPRIGAPTAGGGSSSVLVGVADTGLDYTHSELRSKVRDVVDLSDPALCKSFVFPFDGKHRSDADLARIYGGPADGDWNGHGSWIGGNIAGALDGKGISGIAPNVGLVALKIAGWCGSANDAQLIKAFVYAANHGIDVVNISFGGYVDRSTRQGEAAYQAYRRAIAYARSKGTTIVGSAGNDHVRLGAEGRVISHGILTAPGSAQFDLYGATQIPAGVPEAVSVSATGNRVVGSSPQCAPGTPGSATDTNATCKPTQDRHQAAGVGQADQLAYYSNYGPGIDIAAPGGARKFNLPVWDRGGTPGFPYTASDLTTVWQDFGITSNFAVEIPCATFTKGSGFYPDECYTAIQGTSMAAPHVAAAVALAASRHPGMRGNVDALVARVKAAAEPRSNATRALSRSDTSAADLTGVACPSGFCHLSGHRISDSDAYGAGLLQVDHL